MEMTLFDDQEKLQKKVAKPVEVDTLPPVSVTPVVSEEPVVEVAPVVEEIAAVKVAPVQVQNEVVDNFEDNFDDDFDFMPDEDAFGAKICVFGVGGGGGNAVKTMIKTGIKGVEFVTANTDRQALSKISLAKRIQIGKNSTRGLGAGAKPEIGRKAAEESIEDIRNAIGKSDMVFITAGMGGGTGTGAAPIIARAAKEQNPNIVTVGVVTKPFSHEGPQRMNHAEQGIKELSEHVDSLIVVPNQRLLNIGSKSARVVDMFIKADEVLCSAVRGIAGLIIESGYINTDFADIQTVMSQRGLALMGVGKAKGENRALEAAKMAIASPLLEDISLKGARGIIVNVSGSDDVLMDEYEQAISHVTAFVDSTATIVTGLSFDPQAGEELSITVIATGLEKGTTAKLPPNGAGAAAKTVAFSADEQVPQKPSTVLHGLNNTTGLHNVDSPVTDDREFPAYIRRSQATRVAAPGEKDFIFTGNEDEIPTFVRTLAN